MPTTNFNSYYTNVLTIQIDLYFPKLYFSLLRALYSLENLSSNFVTIFRLIPHNSEEKYAVFWNVAKVILYPFLKALNMKLFTILFKIYTSFVHISCSFIYVSYISCTFSCKILVQEPVAEVFLPFLIESLTT